MTAPLLLVRAFPLRIHKLASGLYILKDSLPINKLIKSLFLFEFLTPCVSAFVLVYSLLCYVWLLIPPPPSSHSCALPPPYPHLRSIKVAPSLFEKSLSLQKAAGGGIKRKGMRVNMHRVFSLSWKRMWLIAICYESLGLSELPVCGENIKGQ